MKAKIVLFTEEVRTELANYFLEYEDYYIADSIPVRNLQVIEELKSVKRILHFKKHSVSDRLSAVRKRTGV